MALNLDEGEKKTSTTKDILDLSHVTVRSEQELKKLLEKIPDFKIRPEKVRNEDIQFDNDVVEERSPNATPSPSHDEASGAAPYLFVNPVPASMREVNIRELGRVNINWRMLTMARPKVKADEEIFTRLVQLEKLQYQTVKWENEQEALRDKKKLPFTRGPIPRGRSRGGALTSGRGASTKAAVTEIRLQTCKECGEEFCTGTCKKYLYDDHARILNPPSNEEIFKVGPTNPIRKQKTVKISSEDGAEKGKSKAVNDTSRDKQKQVNGKGTSSSVGPKTITKDANVGKINKGPVDLSSRGTKPKTSHTIKKQARKIK